MAGISERSIVATTRPRKKDQARTALRKERRASLRTAAMRTPVSSPAAMAMYETNMRGSDGRARARLSARSASVRTRAVFVEEERMVREVRVARVVWELARMRKERAAVRRDRVIMRRRL